MIKLKPVRLTVLALMILVALCAVGLEGYRAYERRRECLAQAKWHEATARSLEGKADLLTRFAKRGERLAEDVADSRFSRLTANYRFTALRRQTSARALRCYARFHERLRYRYLDVARHPWRGVPDEKSLADGELIASLEAIANEDVSNPAGHQELGVLWSGLGDYARALEEYEVTSRLLDGDFRAYDDSAWILATCPDPKIRDGTKSLALARRACDLTKWREPRCLDTLAAAYAEAGQFDSAVEWQAKAIKLLRKSSSERAEYVERLHLYEEMKPYRAVR